MPELNDERKKLAADLESKRSVLEKRQKVFSGQEEKIKLMELDGQGNFVRGNFSRGTSYAFHFVLRLIGLILFRLAF